MSIDSNELAMKAKATTKPDVQVPLSQINPRHTMTSKVKDS